MSEEYCAGVRILIERMTTNPEDFADGDYDFANMQTRKETKFGQLAKMLEQLLTGRDKERLLESWAEWHYLTKAEQDALLTAYKNMRRVEFDKRIMERVFDEKFYIRQEEEAQAKLQAQMQKMALRNQMMAVNPANNVISNLQPGQYQAAQNISKGGIGTGMLGSIGSALGFSK